MIGHGQQGNDKFLLVDAFSALSVCTLDSCYNTSWYNENSGIPAMDPYV